MNVLMFCANPINGGTARVFYELVVMMRRLTVPGDEVVACVNKNNPVEIYKQIEGLVRLPVYSEEEVCAGMYGGSMPERMVKRLCRKARYQRIKKRNINIMREFLEKNRMKAVVIHNGGYVGDDLCNQMLTAAYRCAEHTLCRTYVLHSDMKKNICSKLRFWTYDRKVSKEVTELVTVSEFTRDRILRSSFISRDIKVINNGLSDVRALSEEEKYGIICVSPEYTNILMIGNFLENKGQHKFIEVAINLCKRSDSYRFAIIGNVYDEVYFNRCKCLIKESGLTEKITVYHGIHNAAEYISLFDILVVPSMFNESFGMISIEAMANRRPVVAFACGGIPEVVTDGKNGFIVPVGYTKRMTNRIEWLAEHEEKRKAMGERCRRDYEKKFSAEAMALKYMKILGMKQSVRDWAGK